MWSLLKIANRIMSHFPLLWTPQAGASQGSWNKYKIPKVLFEALGNGMLRLPELHLPSSHCYCYSRTVGVLLFIAKLFPSCLRKAGCGGYKHGLWNQIARSLISDLFLNSFVTLNSFLVSLSLGFYICKMEITVVSLSEGCLRRQCISTSRYLTCSKHW